MNLRRALKAAIGGGETERSARAARSVARVLEQGFWLVRTSAAPASASLYRLERPVARLSSPDHRGE